MAVRRTIEIDGLDSLLRRLDHIDRNLFETDLFAEIGDYLIFKIQDVTATGKDVEGFNFAPYTPRYRLFRQEAGHPVDKVNLFFSGSMMSSMTREATESQVRVFFMNTSDRSGTSNPLKAYALNKKRRFFAVSVEAQRKIIDIIRRRAREILDGRA